NYSFQVMASSASGDSPVGTSNIIATTGTATTYASTVLADGPRFYYRLGESSGSWSADSAATPNPHHAYGTGVLGATGAILGDSDTAETFNGNQVQFASGSAYADLPTGNADRSVDLWFKTSIA